MNSRSSSGEACGFNIFPLWGPIFPLWGPHHICHCAGFDDKQVESLGPTPTDRPCTGGLLLTRPARIPNTPTNSTNSTNSTNHENMQTQTNPSNKAILFLNGRGHSEFERKPEWHVNLSSEIEHCTEHLSPNCLFIGTLWGLFCRCAAILIITKQLTCGGNCQSTSRAPTVRLPHRGGGTVEK